jgi:beta-lactamase class D
VKEGNLRFGRPKLQSREEIQNLEDWNKNQEVGREFRNLKVWNQEVVSKGQILMGYLINKK